ncbi:hypothetical protein A2917_00035 [Candidatus Nomurabacteria bacterium RIFCSPLOWO2_01_FULL_42_17]|uniref:DUF4430 domain-containing protein n=1 Tax=Candidatus Nomurabacteria bacterium RIFCSPLOWO2_01_FULL_42_17 TaxID=1801780 RepID=A0A1F6XNE0_9BACT|nr:MAG: hypothetical protein A2917_00035 [Candidatus Nomurabacteria bacterium RIFCSPLOWO2_01_FULL_42_17]
MIQNKKLIKNLLITLFLLGLLAFLIYSFIEYQKSGIAKDGVVTCVNEQCFWSAHIHLNVPIQICGEEYALPKFKGSLADHHTHGDENVIHWHDKVAFDAEKKQFSGPTPFVLDLIFKNLGLPITDESLLNKKDGDACHGFISTWKVFINGVLHSGHSDWRNYEWKDRDIIMFIFDEREAEEVEAELRQKPITFPNVGEG